LTLSGTDQITKISIFNLESIFLQTKFECLVTRKN